ncbi:MAG: ATP-binding cassette subfamily C bacterial [Rhodocyclaceae bacterium]|nr:MAG: ATP-binding cassette subfamily C bacterial [Rhodocyclaceae bacterium]TND03158.1 MAG: ATP-binding cassette, subfamily C, bacterial [Rhodocyclaceae bacterium]
MRQLIGRFRPFFVYAGLFSLCVNLLLLVPSLYMLQVFDRVLASRSNETLVMLTLAAAVALIIMGLLDLLRARLLATAGITLDAMLGPQVLDGLLANAAKLGGTEYVHGLRDVSVLRGFLTGSGIFALFDAPWLPCYIILIFVFHPLLGSVALVGAGLLILLAFFNEKLTREPLERLQSGSRRAARFVDTSLRNAEVVSALGMLPAVTRRWAGLNTEVQKLQIDTTHLAGVMSGATKFMRQFIQIAMLCAGAYLVIDQHVTGGVMMAATIILGRALAPVEMLIGGWRTLVDARSAYARLDKLLESQAARQDVTELPPPEGRLSVERVVFAAKGSDKAIIKGASFELPAGDSMGLIGPSASGKSTLARLIIGVWKPLSGVVRIDGADVASWPRERIGQHVGYLPQDVELFSGSVAENIARLGDGSSAAVIAAAQRANAHEMVLRLPQGYDTQIGEGGASLSGGQRQRIGLARALYGDPRLVVLDEPNANLDAEGETALMQAMAELKQAGVTLILITHRPSILSGVDKLLVLREGMVEAYGPRAEVMARVTPRGMPPAPGAIKAVDGGAGA